MTKELKEFYKHFVSPEENLSSMWLGSFGRWLEDLLQKTRQATLKEVLGIIDDLKIKSSYPESGTRKIQIKLLNDRIVEPLKKELKSKISKLL